MKHLVGCLVVGIALTVHAQEFTSAPAKAARDNYLNGLAKLDATYKAALESALRQADMKKDIEEADRIKAALTELAENQSLAAMAPNQLSRLTFRTAKVQAGKSPGYEIGKVRKGDTLVIKYDRGMFSGKDLPLSSPDTTDKIVCRLVAKSGKAYAPLATIPMGTKDRPFEYTFESDLEAVAFQTGDWRDSGEVSYKIALIKAK